MKIVAEELWEEVNLSSLTKFSKQLKKTDSTLQKGRILLEENDYQTMIKLIDHFNNYRVGKNKLVAYRNSRRHTDNELTSSEDIRIIADNRNELSELKLWIENISISIASQLRGNI